MKRLKQPVDQILDHKISKQQIISVTTSKDITQPLYNRASAKSHFIFKLYDFSGTILKSVFYIFRHNLSVAVVGRDNTKLPALPLL